jgi:hypothetical protein
MKSEKLIELERLSKMMELSIEIGKIEHNIGLSNELERVFKTIFN